jgi:hypothetical protein
VSGVDLDDEAGDGPAAGPTGEGPLSYVGTVVRWNPDSGTGSIRTSAGKELEFDVEHAIVLGALVAGPRAFAITNGQPIGYDVGWTSRGLRVTKLFPAA